MSRRNPALSVLYYTVLLLTVVVMMLPIVVSIGNSFRTQDAEIFNYTQVLSIYTFFPKTFTLNQYGRLFGDAGFGVPVVNSFVVAVLTVAFGFLVNGLAGFTFAKYNFRGKRLIFLVFLFSFMIPFEVIAIPLYKTCAALGILEKRAALILPMIGNGMIVFLYMQFFKDLPDSLIESARIDGAGTLRIYFRLIVPLSFPVIISASLMMFIQQWDAFLWPLVAASSKSLKVMQVAIAEFYGENFTDWTLIYSATSIAILIPALILIPLQKYFIQGVAGTGLKE